MLSTYIFHLFLCVAYNMQKDFLNKKNLLEIETEKENI